MSVFPSFDAPPGYQFDPSILLSALSNVDPALTLVAPERPESPELTFELLLTLTLPPKCVRTPNRKTKKKKPETESVGPFNVPFKIAWIDFLKLMAEKIDVDRTDLLLSTFEWHWIKPVNGPWIPARDENGFVSMVKKIKTKYEAKPETVMFHMDAPSKYQSSVLLRSAQDVGEEVDLEEPVPKKMKLDDALEEIVANLTNKYPPGLCPLHPSIPCFHHRAADLHFHLVRPRLLVWAQAIKSGTAMYEKVPIVSPMFKSSHALKRASRSSADLPAASTPPTTPPPPPPPPPPSGLSTSVPTQAQMPAMPFPTYFPYPQMPFAQVSPQMPLFMGYGGLGMPYPGNPFAAGASTEATRPPRHQSRSPPSSPPTATCSIADFCKSYNLGPQAESGLDHLGFEFGDDLRTVTESQYTNAGFKPLEWRRVLKAYRQLKVDNRHTA